MLEWILSSSVLIAVVLVLRYALRGRIDPRLQYALWAVVLLRLLIPFSLGDVPFSVMNTTPAQTITDNVSPTWRSEPSPLGQNQGEAPATLPSGAAQPAESSLFQELGLVWLAGAAGVGACLLAVNFSFSRRLRHARRPVETGMSYLPLYVTDAVETPCLFGLFRPAIYVTQETLADPRTLRHVIEHETTHFCHGDHCWAVLRSLCVALHWYNPLVWWAASLSRRDGEAACDETTIRNLGETERAAYGRTLLSMTCQHPAGFLTTATTMTGSGIQERIALIVKKPKMKVCTVVALAAIVLVAVGCTFTGGSDGTEGASGTVPLQQVFSDQVPEAVADQAEAFVAQRIADTDAPWIEEYGCTVSQGKIVGLTPVSTGMAALNDGVEVYHLDYRLRIRGNIDSILFGGLSTDRSLLTGNWLIQDDFYLAFYWRDTDGETVWALMDSLSNIDSYATQDHLDRYGSWETAFAAQVYDRCHTMEMGELTGGAAAVSIQHAFPQEVPDAVVAYAENYITEQINHYHASWPEMGSDCTVTEAKITSLVSIPTGMAALNDGVAVYRLEYRLHVKGNVQEVLVGGMDTETINGEAWLTESSSLGQPYLLLYWRDQEGETLWQPAGLTSDEALIDYNTPALLAQYGDKFTAVAAERYAKYHSTYEQ